MEREEVKERGTRQERAKGKKKPLQFGRVKSSNRPPFPPPAAGPRRGLPLLPGAHRGREAAFAATERREVTAAGAAATAERRVAAIFCFFSPKRGREDRLERERGRRVRAGRKPSLFFFIFFFHFFFIFLIFFYGVSQRILFFKIFKK